MHKITTTLLTCFLLVFLCRPAATRAEPLRVGVFDVDASPPVRSPEEMLLAILDDDSKTDLERGSAATDLAWLRRCQHNDTVDVSCLRIGKAYIVHLPGEAVVENQLAAQ